MPAISSSRSGNTPLPHEPTIGLRTSGKPVLLIVSIADSALNANWVLGVGILLLASTSDVKSLLPQISPTLNLFITGKLRNSRHAVRYRPR